MGEAVLEVTPCWWNDLGGDPRGKVRGDFTAPSVIRLKPSSAVNRELPEWGPLTMSCRPGSPDPHICDSSLGLVFELLRLRE